MTCRDVYHDVLELARGAREAAGATHARAHLVNCASCRERFAQQQALSAGLRAMSMVAQADDRPGELHPRVIEAFAELAALESPTESAALKSRTALRAEGGVESATDSRVDLAALKRRTEMAALKSRTALRMRMAAGLAAVAVAASWWAFRGSEGNMPPSKLPSRPIAPVQGQVVPSPVATPVGRRSASPLPVRQRSARHQTAHLLSPEGFMSLPGAAGLPDFERGEILRLEIAVASLPNYGVEIPPDAEDRPIEVDILVGQDGHPRAIRLVNLKAQMRYVETNR